MLVITVIEKVSKYSNYRVINTFYRVTKEPSRTSCQDTEITGILHAIETKENSKDPNKEVKHVECPHKGRSQQKHAKIS